MHGCASDLSRLGAGEHELVEADERLVELLELVRARGSRHSSRRGSRRGGRGSEAAAAATCGGGVAVAAGAVLPKRPRISSTVLFCDGGGFAAAGAEVVGAELPKISARRSWLF